MTKADTASSEGRKKTLKAHGLSLTLPAKLPFLVTKFISGDDPDIDGVLRAVLGDEQAEKVWNAGLDIDQGNDLVKSIMDKYEVSAGE